MSSKTLRQSKGESIAWREVEERQARRTLSTSRSFKAAGLPADPLMEDLCR